MTMLELFFKLIYIVQARIWNSYPKSPPNIRFVKGAYKESTEVAFPNKADVDENYVKLIQQHLINRQYAAIATHDEQIIHKIKAFLIEKEMKRGSI